MIYATHAYIIDDKKITRCEVTKRTPKTITVNYSCEWTGNWKRTFRLEDGKVFDTWQEAHAALLAAAEQEVAAARLHLQRLNGRLGNVKGMKPPQEDQS